MNKIILSLYILIFTTILTTGQDLSGDFLSSIGQFKLGDFYLNHNSSLTFLEYRGNLKGFMCKTAINFQNLKDADCKVFFNKNDKLTVIDLEKVFNEDYNHFSVAQKCWSQLVESVKMKYGPGYSSSNPDLDGKFAISWASESIILKIELEYYGVSNGSKISINLLDGDLYNVK